MVTLVWGATFPALKYATQYLSGVEVTGLRFAIAGLLMLPFALRASRAAWRDGAVLGILVLVSYVAQAYGLQFISSNRSAFLTSLNVLMVPLIGLMFGNRASWWLLAAAVMAFTGIALMSWDGGSDLVADISTVAGALAYALYVILLSKKAPHHSPIHLASTQILWMAVLGLLWVLGASLGNDRLQTLPDRLNGTVLLALLYLGVVATAGMLLLQAWAQRKVAADQAAVIYAMEPVFAALFAWILLAEVLSLTASMGAAMVVLAVLLSEWRSNPTPSTS